MSSLTTDWTVTALAQASCSGIRDVCDIGGGHGHLGCALLKAYPQFQMTVFDLPQVVNETDHLWAPKLGLTLSSQINTDVSISENNNTSRGVRIVRGI